MKVHDAQGKRREGCQTVDGVTSAMERRQSVRAFLPTPIDRETVMDILTIAGRAPSNGNLQPWQVHAVGGPVLREIEARSSAMAAAGKVTDGPPVPVYPRGLWEPYKSRRHLAGVERYAAMGFMDKDAAGLRRLVEMNCGFFGAPVGLIFCVQSGMERHQWCDMGMFMQSVMLLATERGLDTCPQAFWTNWAALLSDVLGLGEDMIVVAGMALGFRDQDHPINRYRTARASLDAYATLHGL